jgi:DNA-binding beta-propeller fold protein YncE
MGASGIAVSSSFAYVGVGASTVDECAIGSMGGVIVCPSTGGGFLGVDGISLANGYAYIANEVGGTVSVCSVGGTGSLSACAISPIAPGIGPSSVAVNGGRAYVNDSNNNNMYLCSVGNLGALGKCVISNGSTTFSGAIQIAIH